MLGEAFRSIFSVDYELKCTDIDINEPWLSYLDFRDFDGYSKDVVDFKPDYLLILAWNFSDSIIKKNIKFLESGGKFIIPLPKLEVI